MSRSILPLGLVLTMLVATMPADAAKVAIANCSGKSSRFCAYNSSDYTQSLFDYSDTVVNPNTTSILTCGSSSSCNFIVEDGSTICGRQDRPLIVRQLGNLSYQYNADGTYTQVGNSSHTFDNYTNACGKVIGGSCSSNAGCIDDNCLGNVCMPKGVSSFAVTCEPVGADVKIYQGQAIASCDKSYVLFMQYDGNLVLYNAGGTAAWATGTNGKGGQFAIFQGDGNFVVYKGAGQPIWASNSHGTGKFIVQNDGNIVIYGANGPFWSSNSYGR